MGWTRFANGALVPDPATTFAEGIAWAGAANFWAPDVHRLPDGKFYYYYCVTAGDSPRSALGLAVANTITGPYSQVAILLRSGMWGEASPDGTIYDATRHPNAVDPHVFLDAIGRRWMVYGSYSGGIFILQLDATTGRPLVGQGYGKKLIGKNHSRIEAPYILYYPATGYYYLFLSFGGLDSTGGYQMRVGRSVNPDGPYFDPSGVNLTNVGGAAGSFFDDAAIAPYGGKLMGNFQFMHVDGEPQATSRGYLSPGHNSAYFDAATGRAFLIFHTRFVGRGEQHEVRVHQLYFNDQGWPVVAPHRFGGEFPGVFTAGQIPGRFKLINHGKDISSAVHESTVITLAADGTITGSITGSWVLSGARNLTLVLGGATYRGVVCRQWDDDNRVWVLAFSALSGSGVAVWGSKVAVANTAPSWPSLTDGAATQGNPWSITLTANDPDAGQVLTYSLVNPPIGASIDPATGVVTWTPVLAQVGGAETFSVRVADNGATSLAATTSFRVAVSSPRVVQRSALTFDVAGTSGLRDGAGVFTGLTARLPGTGASAPTNDPLLSLATGSSVLAITSSRSDYNGSVSLASNRSVGLALAGLGFTGNQDFAATAVFRAFPTLASVDQVGLYVGANGTSLTRAGAIRFGTQPEAYAVHTQGGADTAAHFGGTTLNAADGMRVTIQRTAGTWRYWVDGVEWPPLAAGVPSAPAFLDVRADLFVGVFATTPTNSVAKVVQLDDFIVVVDTGLTPLESWRVAQFGASATGPEASDTADPDADGLANLLEYALGSAPRDGAVSARPAVAVADETGGGRRLILGFTRIADPALTYEVEAADAVAGPWTVIWTSNGAANKAGPLTVQDSQIIAASGIRFLRLRVRR